MKFNGAKLVLCLLFFCFSKKISAGNPTADSTSFLISFASTDVNKLNAVKKAIHSQANARYLKFCTNHSVIMVRVAGDNSAADALVDAVRKATDCSPQILSVKAYSFGDIEETCTSDNAPFGLFRH